MNDERFEQLMRDAARNYNRPPDVPPYEEMWESIERGLDGARPEEQPQTRPFLVGQRKYWMTRSWVRMAAVLVLGIAVGRASVSMLTTPASDALVVAPEEPVVAATRVAGGYRSDTHHYLGQTAALLIALPEELRAEHTDSAFLSRADELLLQTRLLLDSPAAADPALRMLFEDLEVVLAQLVRLQSDPDATKIDMLNQSLEQRDVLPRLRNAVVDHIAD